MKYGQKENFNKKIKKYLKILNIHIFIPKSQVILCLMSKKRYNAQNTLKTKTLGFSFINTTKKKPCTIFYLKILRKLRWWDIYGVSIYIYLEGKPLHLTQTELKYLKKWRHGSHFVKILDNSEMVSQVALRMILKCLKSVRPPTAQQKLKRKPNFFITD